MIKALAVVVVVAALVGPCGVTAMDKALQCTACSTVADELGRAVQKEMPQMALDLRNRLDPSGKRQGKVVDYQVSELRAIELTEGLCNNMDDYAPVKQKDGKMRYQKINNADGPVEISGSLSLGGESQETEMMELRLFCDRLVEAHEEEIEAMLLKSEPGSEDFGTSLRGDLCGNLASLCSADDLVKLPKLPGAGDSRLPSNGGAPAKKSKKKKGNKKKKKKGKKKGKKKATAGDTEL